MRNRIIAVVVILALGAGIGALVFKRHRSPEVSRERMVEQFIAMVSDSLDGDRILEIRQIFYLLYEREKVGKVKPETSAAITAELAQHVAKGHIAPGELVHFMAEVGYSTYKDEERFNLPDSSVDHPALNPDAGRVSLKFDSTQYDSSFWADFEKWKKENPDVIDSLNQEMNIPPPKP